MSPDRARSRGLTSTVCFPVGNLAPEGSVIKSTSIDPSLVDADGSLSSRGPASVFITEAAAIAAIKHGEIGEGDVMVLICGGPLGAGMQEIYQITSALKALPFGKHVAVLTDARFSGVSTGACIGHISPEALAGGPIGKVRDGDRIEIVIDRRSSDGTVNLIGDRARDDSAQKKAPPSCRATIRAPIWRRIPHCPTTRACGPRWCRPAAASGADASTMPTRLSLSSTRRERMRAISDEDLQHERSRLDRRSQQRRSSIHDGTPASDETSLTRSTST